MKILKASGIGVATFILLATVTCKKNNVGCYDELLYQQNKNNNCPMDCHGVTGCDGKTYCNECEANRQGIRIKK